MNDARHALEPLLLAEEHRQWVNFTVQLHGVGTTLYRPVGEILTTSLQRLCCFALGPCNVTRTSSMVIGSFHFMAWSFAELKVNLNSPVILHAW